MWIGIALVLLGVANALERRVPEKYRNPLNDLVTVLCILFGVWNVVQSEQAVTTVDKKLDRIGTVFDWQRSEPTVEVLLPQEKTRAEYTLALKIIPRDHPGLKGMQLEGKRGHGLNEPQYLEESQVRALFGLMADKNGDIDIRNEYESGIQTYYYTGRYDLVQNVVRFHIDAQSYWPNLYPSQRDLEGTYVIARIVAGVKDPVLASLRLEVSSPVGTQLLLFLLPIIQPSEGDPNVPMLVRNSVRYVGGYIEEGKFLKQR